MSTMVATDRSRRAQRQFRDEFKAGTAGLMLDAGQFDWTAISPAIFGAMFKSVIDPADHRAQGAHYTTENRT